MIVMSFYQIVQNFNKVGTPQAMSGTPLSLSVTVLRPYVLTEVERYTLMSTKGEFNFISYLF